MKISNLRQGFKKLYSHTVYICKNCNAKLAEFNNPVFKKCPFCGNQEIKNKKIGV